MALYRFTECCWWLKSAVLIELAGFAGWNSWAQYHFSSLCLWFRVAAEMISEVAAAEGREPILSSLGTAVLFWPCAKSFREPSSFSPGIAFHLFPKGSESWPMSWGGARLFWLYWLGYNTKITNFFLLVPRSADRSGYSLFPLLRSCFTLTFVCNPVCNTTFSLLIPCWGSSCRVCPATL